MTGCVKPKRRPPEAKRDRVDESPEAFVDPGFMESFARLHISARAKSRWRGETTVQLADQEKSGGARGAAEDSSGAERPAHSAALVGVRRWPGSGWPNGMIWFQSKRCNPWS